jgi:hypothetical protein
MLHPVQVVELMVRLSAHMSPQLEEALLLETLSAHKLHPVQAEEQRVCVSVQELPQKEEALLLVTLSARR